MYGPIGRLATSPSANADTVKRMLGDASAFCSTNTRPRVSAVSRFGKRSPKTETFPVGSDTL